MLTSKVTNKNIKTGFTLVEILIVMIIAGLGLMTVAPRLAEKTILTDQTEVFFNEIIESHLKTAQELGMQVFVKGFKGSPNIEMYDGTREVIPAGNVESVLINNENPVGTEYFIYFYPDGIFDHFLLTFTGEDTLESSPALKMVVHR